MNEESHLDEATLDRLRSDELEEAERERAAAHLEGCPRCAAALAELEAFSGTVGRGYAAARTLAAGREPDWAAQRAAIVERTSGRRERSRLGGLLRWAPQAAVVLAALIALGVLVEEGVRGPGDAERIRREAPAPAPAGGDREEELDRRRAAQEPPARERPAEAPAPLESRETREPAVEDPAVPEAEAEVEQEGAEPEGGAAVEPEPRAMAKAVPQRGERRDRAGETPLDRYRALASRAISERDTLAARGALALWRDSLAAADLPAEQRREGQALADTLDALLDGPSGGPPE
ncbi:MAG: hypothetical protein R3199_06005 [Gemmatimonadota bacterium]|nr:hypothetical protein [Gemmatimonadota bacterium]